MKTASGLDYTEIEAWDASERIGEADHDRFVIDEAKFLAKVEAKRQGG